MLAYFSRKACNIKELKDVFGKGKSSRYEIEAIVALEPLEYESFSNNLLADQIFIEENIKHMYVDDDDVWHCILVIAKGAREGILVESEGYFFARYSSYYAG